MMLLVALVLFVLTERTRLGRLLYATGGNEVATIRLAGANVNRIKTFAYVLLASQRWAVIVPHASAEAKPGASLLMDLAVPRH